MNKSKTLLATALFSAMATTAQAGSEIETLITMLHENGMVSDEQYGRLVAELEQNKAQSVEKDTKIQAQLTEATKPSDVEVKVKGGVTVKTRDGKFSTKLGGRLQADAATYSGDPEMGDGTEIRRARLYLEGTMYSDWGYKLQYDFASTGANGKGIADAYIDYNGFDDLQLRVGNFKDPFSLQEQTSSKFTSFTERALPSAFAAGRHIGVMASTKQQHWSLAGGVFGDSLTATNTSTTGTKHENDEGWGLGARATFAPVNEKTKVIHLGLGLNYRDTGGLGTTSFSQQAETHISGINIVNTGTITGVSDFLKVGAEVATVMGPFSAQAEYITTSVSRNNASDLDFNGWYAQAGYFFTGESRNYKKGAFGSITPKASVGEGGIGAWELGLRYSTVDLTDADITGGEADSVTLGVNWYATPTLRFSANYIDVLDVKGGTYDDQEPRIFQVRSQWAF
ncbi:MAG: porin [Gammaproteobacteria bacterium]|nr:porin [Gammaproteobacteria bacterium]